MENIKSQVESLLFISGRPMSTKQLADLAKTKTKEVEEALKSIMAEYQEKGSGIQVVKNGVNYQMVTQGENAKLIQDFIKDETTGELTRPSLETLTIIAYRGPVSKIDLDRIRGINCALILRNLLIRGLVEAKKDRGDTYYTVSFDFLKHLGLNDISELPDYDRLHQDDTIDKILEEADNLNK